MQFEGVIVKTIRIITLITLLTLTSLSGQSVRRVGTTAAPWLKIGVGARGLAMGEAMVTHTEDVTAMYWNAAGLGRMQQSEAVFNRYNYVADLNFDYIGVALVLPGAGTIGINYTSLGGDDIERTTEYMQDGTGELVSYGFYAVGISYGQALTDRFSIGGTAKYVRENIWHCDASTMALDLGVLYHTHFYNSVIGMSISNFGPAAQMSGSDLLQQVDTDPLHEGNNDAINAELSTGEFNLPIFFRVGISVNILQDVLKSESQDLILALDAVHPNDNLEYLNLGLEYFPIPQISLRCGHRQLLLEDREGGPAVGAGLNFSIRQFQIHADYARVDYGRLEYANKFTLMVRF